MPPSGPKLSRDTVALLVEMAASHAPNLRAFTANGRGGMGLLLAKVGGRLFLSAWQPST